MKKQCVRDIDSMYFCMELISNNLLLITNSEQLATYLSERTKEMNNILYAITVYSEPLLESCTELICFGHYAGSTVRRIVYNMASW